MSRANMPRVFLAAGVAAALLLLVRGQGNAVALQGSEVVAPPCGGACGETVRDLHQEYYNVFKHGNRNAASHLWSAFLLDRSSHLSPEKLRLMFSGFCAVSGSPVQPQERTRYRLNLELAGGGGARRTGYMYYCCWPCVCDTQDFIKVDTKTITTADGVARQYHFAVIGNPCEHAEKLTKPFDQRGQQTILSQVAPEVRCGANGELIGAPISDHGNIIISMFFDEDVGASENHANDEGTFAGHCAQRAAANFNSGMGDIFRQVASISPVTCAKAEEPTKLLEAAPGGPGVCDNRSGACDGKVEAASNIEI